MTYLEFHERVRALANGSFFSTAVRATEFSKGETRIEWSGYISAAGLHSSQFPEHVLDTLERALHPKPDDVASVGAVIFADPVRTDLPTVGEMSAGRTGGAL